MQADQWSPYLGWPGIRLSSMSPTAHIKQAGFEQVLHVHA